MFAAFNRIKDAIQNKTKILVLFGSQQGNTKAIAQQICGIGNNNGFNMQLYALNECVVEKERDKATTETRKEYELSDVLRAASDTTEYNVIIVCSTSGDGEPPDNAKYFWNFLRNRKLPKNLFNHLNFVVLAVGDSNYRSYCAAGKYIDRRLEELGALRPCKQKITEVDTVGDMEAVVEPFKREVWKLFKDNVVTTKVATTAEDNPNYKDMLSGYFSERSLLGGFFESVAKDTTTEATVASTKSDTSKETLAP